MTKIINGLFFFPIICLIGIFTSYEDNHTSKIRNKWILIGLIYSVSIYISAWITLQAQNYINSDAILTIVHGLTVNIDKWCFNLIISSVVAYSLWHFNIWGPGDAKLFICYAALIPISQYSKVYFSNYFASAFLLLAIFIPAMLSMFIRSLIFFLKQIDFNKSIPISKKMQQINAPEAIKIITGFIVIFLLFQAINTEVPKIIHNYSFNQYFSVLISLVAFGYLSNFFKKNFILSIALFSLLLFYFNMTRTSSLLPELIRALIKTSITMMLFPLYRNVTDLYFKESNRETIPFAFWMFLGVLIVWIIPC